MFQRCTIQFRNKKAELQEEKKISSDRFGDLLLLVSVSDVLLLFFF